MRGVTHAVVFLLAAAPAVLSAPPRPCDAAPAPRAVEPVAAKLKAPARKVAAAVTLPDEVKGKVGEFVVIRAETEGKTVKFVTLDAGLTVFPADLLTDKKATVVSALAAGRYRVLAYSAVGGEPTEPAIVTVVIGDAPPVPPTPPQPKPPEPKPPEPKPPTPAPEGFRVIFVYESSQALTPAMQQVMFGEKVRQYLDAKSKGYRRFDKDVDAANEKDAEMKALWQAARPQVTAVPCVIVAVGGKAEIIPFPAGEDAAVELFKKYGG